MSERQSPPIPPVDDFDEPCPTCGSVARCEHDVVCGYAGCTLLSGHRAPHSPAQSRSSAAGSSSSPSVAPTDSRPDAKGQEPA